MNPAKKEEYRKHKFATAVTFGIMGLLAIVILVCIGTWISAIWV